MGSAGVERTEGAAAATALVVLGVALVSGAIAHGVRYGAPRAQIAVVATPGLLLLLGLGYVLWGSLRAETYRTVSRWVFGGLVVFGGGVAGVLFFGNSASLTTELAVRLSVFFAGIGAVGGLLVGVKSVQAVEEARRAEEARTSALLFAAERDRLTHLSETSHELISVTDRERTASHLAEGLDQALVGDPAVWLVDRVGGLRPATDATPDAPGPAGRAAFEEGAERAVTGPDGSSRFYVPLAGHGLLAATLPPGLEFDERTRELVRVYARTGQSALERGVQQLELERQNERLDEFASVVSHDLRNPLSVIEGRAELAIEEGDVAHVEPILRNADRMNRLVDDLLALAREGSDATERRPVKAGRLVEDAWASVDTGAAVLKTPVRLPVIEVDPEQFQRLFENLFRNAVEHGSTGNRASSDDAVEHCGESVTVRVTPLPDVDDGLAVTDDGPGIAPDARDAVFERGYTTGGNGLGLAIVDDIVRGHGGTVVVTESPEGGASFELRGFGPTDGEPDDAMADEPGTDATGVGDPLPTGTGR